MPKLIPFVTLTPGPGAFGSWASKSRPHWARSSLTKEGVTEAVQRPITVSALTASEPFAVMSYP